MNPNRIILSLILSVAVYLLPLGLPAQAQLMLFVMIFVASLWISEAAPLYATALFAAFLLIVLVGLEPKDVFAQYFDPVIVLLLGGFVIAVAMNKYKLDEYMAYKIIGKAGSKPAAVVFALIATSAFISMWISNSATAAIIMPIALVILAKNKIKKGSNFSKSCVLAVAYGATIGGIGTIIGSTPNIIAAKFLHDAGVQFGFYEWFYRGFPFMLILMVLGWFVLINVYRPEKKAITTLQKKMCITKGQKIVAAVFALTVTLWITESIHGLANSSVSLIPIILFYFTGLLRAEDFLKIDWPTLILVGGGLALGAGLHATSLDTVLSSMILGITGGQSIIVLFLILGLFGVILTSVVSNTTAGAVYLPIIVALASSFGADITNVVVVAAIGVSLDFIFPFGTPPTAIAYGTGFVKTKDIAKAGLVISLIGIMLLVIMGMLW